MTQGPYDPTRILSDGSPTDRAFPDWKAYVDRALRRLDSRMVQARANETQPFKWDTGTSVQYATSVGNTGVDTYAYGATAVVPAGGARWCLISLGRSGWAPTNGACFLKFWTWVNGSAEQWLMERFHNNASPAINFAGHWNIALPTSHLAPGATFDNRGLLNVDPGGSGFWLGASGYSISWFR